MIGKLTGTLAERNPPQVVVDCNGVGYEVDVPMSTFYNLPHIGERISLLTHFVVREDAQILYGRGRRWPWRRGSTSCIRATRWCAARSPASAMPWRTAATSSTPTSPGIRSSN